MTSQNDDNPALSIDISDIDKKVGRLYRRPDFILPEPLTAKKVKELVIAGDLVPSTTNILGVRSSPFLLPWATKLTATEMLEMALTQTDMFMRRIKANRYGAIKYFQDASIRQRDFWGNQGTRVHKACEMIARNEELDYSIYTDYELKCIEEFKKWLDIYQPTFKFIEITGFGQTEDKLQYAQTTDFIAEFNGKDYIGDYKCVVNDTPILLPNGSTVHADTLKKGDQVVAWTKEKGLHVAPVSYAGDNGKHKVVTVTTSTGQQITTTLNHPFWSSRKNQGLAWVKGEDLRVGDELYVALGWNYSPGRETMEWPYRKNLSPYLYGLMWALCNFSTQDWKTEKFIDLPRISRPGLREELSEIGFTFNKAGQLNTSNGLAKIARKNKMTVEEILDMFQSPELPDYVYGAGVNHVSAFTSGVMEIFANREKNPEELYIVLNDKALRNLQQFYLNYGQPAVITTDSKSGLQYIKVPFESRDTIFAHGPTATRITSISISEDEQSTVALEVEGSHTHITAGLITHNTNRSGLHDDVALQLAANARVTDLYPDNKTLEIMPPVAGGLGVHISPKGVVMKEVDISEDMFAIFTALRKTWDFHAFEGKLRSSKGVYIREIKDAKDL
jgi:hypothetical protein